MKSFKEYITESGINLGKINSTKSIKLLHHTDLDGISSAIMAYNQLLKQGIKPEQITLSPVQYGANDKGVWNLKKGQKGVVVDFGDFGDEASKVLDNKEYWVSDHHEKKDDKKSLNSARHGSDSSSSAIRKVLQNKLDEIMNISGELAKKTNSAVSLAKGITGNYKTELTKVYNELRPMIKGLLGIQKYDGATNIKLLFDKPITPEQMKEVWDEKDFDKKIDLLRKLGNKKILELDAKFSSDSHYKSKPIDTSLRNRSNFDRIFNEFITATKDADNKVEAINNFFSTRKIEVAPNKVSMLAKIVEDYVKHSADMKSVYKSDAARLATFHTQNIADQKFVSDLKRVDSADFVSLEKLVKMDDTVKENFAHLSNTIISKMIKPDMVHNSAHVRTTGLTEYLIRNAKPTLTSFLTTMFSKKGQELMKAESSFYKNKDEASLSKLSKTTKRKALQGSSFHEEEVISQIEKLMVGNWKVNSKELKKLANSSGWEDYKIKEFVKALDEGNIKGMKEAIKARRKELNFIDKAGRRDERNDASSYKQEIEQGRENLKKQVAVQTNPETSAMVKVSSVLCGAESPKDMNRFLPPVLTDEKYGRFPVYFRSWNDMIQFAVNSDLDKETASKINLVEIGKEAIKEIKYDTARDIADIHSKYGHGKTLFDFGIEKVENQVGGHKPIVTISKLSMPALAPKGVRQVSDKEKEMEARIKKLKDRGINVEPLEKQLEAIKAKNKPVLAVKEELSTMPKIMIKKIISIVDKKLQEVLKGSNPTYKEASDPSFKTNMKEFEPAKSKDQAVKDNVSAASKNVSAQPFKTYVLKGSTFVNKDWLKATYRATFNAPDKTWVIRGALTPEDIKAIEDKGMTIS